MCNTESIKLTGKIIEGGHTGVSPQSFGVMHRFSDGDSPSLFNLIFNLLCQKKKTISQFLRHRIVLNF